MFYKNIIFSTLILSLRRSFTTSEVMATGLHPAGTFSIAYVTVPNEELAKKLAKGLVSQKLAACVNIIPQLTSIYEWKGEIQEDKELLLMIKTRSSLVNELTKYVQANHSYEVCEVISVPIENGNPSYLKWLGEVVPEKNE